MKKIIFSAILLVSATACFSQQKKTNLPTLSKQDYLQKSKHQKTIAWVLLGGGTALALTGVIIPKGDIVHEGFLGNDYKNDGIKSGFKLTGTLSIIGSILFFTASEKNKKRALSVSFKNETAPHFLKNNFTYKSIPSLNLKINL